jgi:MoaA/NifB/PqqE/SkfB family radical SAM enzyme
MIETYDIGAPAPHLLQIETSNYCPNACVFCPHEKICNKGMMDMDLFKRIIDQAAEMKIKKIVPFQNGDPFTDPLLFERLDYVKEKMPWVEFELFTNCALLDKEKIQKLKNYNFVLINLSINAATKETYEKTCGRKHFDKVIENALELVKELTPKIKVRVSMIPCPEAKDDVEKFKEFWSKYPVEVQVNEYFNWQGRIWKSKEVKLQPCIRIIAHLNVQYDGKVIWCCMDIGEHIIGDLTKQTLQEVWDKTEYRRLMHTQGKRMCLEPCYRYGNQT